MVLSTGVHIVQRKGGRDENQFTLRRRIALDCNLFPLVLIPWSWLRGYLLEGEQIGLRRRFDIGEDAVRCFVAGMVNLRGNQLGCHRLGREGTA